MSWVKFLENRDVRDGSGEVVASFKKGERHDLKESSCRHWLDRGAAERCDPPPPEKVVKAGSPQETMAMARGESVTVDVSESPKPETAKPSAEKATSPPDDDGEDETESKSAAKRTTGKRSYTRTWRR